MCNYRHPGPRRVWEVGSEPQFLTPLRWLPVAPVAPGGSRGSGGVFQKAHFCCYLQYLSVRELPANHMKPKSTPKEPRRSQGHPKEPKGIPKGPHGSQMTPQTKPKGLPEEPKGGSAIPKEVKYTQKHLDTYTNTIGRIHKNIWTHTHKQVDRYTKTC